MNFLWWSWHGTCPRTRHFSLWGYIFVKLIRKAEKVAKTNPQMHKAGR
jgi:hypothetical protein